MNVLKRGNSLEFKHGTALAPANEARQELVKDYTGFVNANDGTIVYGVAEDEKPPRPRIISTLETMRSGQ